MLGYNDEQKLGLSVEECVQHVYKAVIEIDGIFYMHTDENSNSPYLIGCRHVTQSMDPDVARTYGLNPSEIQHAVELLKNTEQMPITMVPVTGESQEEGILIIKNEEYTVNSRESDHMYFIYDKKRDDLFIKRLVEKLAVTALVYENFQRVSTLQLGATLQAIAKGLPIFEVTIDESLDVHVTNTGTV
jgi:hypothetical protein